MPNAATTSANPNDILKDGDVLRLEVSPMYANIQVIPNGNEGLDANFPRNLHNAAELFLKCGLVPNAVNLKDCTDDLLELYQKDPTSATRASEASNGGQSSLRIGRASVCWECGHCGIPKDYKETQVNPGPCANCSGTAQVNWVQIQSSEGNSALPWIERVVETKPKTPEEKAQELAAKRAAIEAKVAAALKEREAATSSK